MENDSPSIRRRPGHKWRDGEVSVDAEVLAVEEPLQIRLGGRRFTVTMRTPGHDEELAAGFLFAEGFIDTRAELDEIRRVRGSRGEPEPNALDVILKVAATDLRHRLARTFPVSSSCGVCGKAAIEALSRRLAPIDSAARISAAALLAMGPRMLKAQAVFAATGGLHAAARFDLDGRLKLVREDVGRHNAVDKLIGNALLKGAIPLTASVMMVSGRASFEIVQKAAAARIPILAAVSAPSSLAVELAEEVGLTLVGFVRATGFNVYAHRERIVS